MALLKALKNALNFRSEGQSPQHTVLEEIEVEKEVDITSVPLVQADDPGAEVATQDLMAGGPPQTDAAEGQLGTLASAVYQGPDIPIGGFPTGEDSPTLPQPGQGMEMPVGSSAPFGEATEGFALKQTDMAEAGAPLGSSVPDIGPEGGPDDHSAEAQTDSLGPGASDLPNIQLFSGAPPPDDSTPTQDDGIPPPDDQTPSSAQVDVQNFLSPDALAGGGSLRPAEFQPADDELPAVQGPQGLNYTPPADTMGAQGQVVVPGTEIGMEKGSDPDESEDEDPDDGAGGGGSGGSGGDGGSGGSGGGDDDDDMPSPVDQSLMSQGAPGVPGGDVFTPQGGPSGDDVEAQVRAWDPEFKKELVGEAEDPTTWASQPPMKWDNVVNKKWDGAAGDVAEEEEAHGGDLFADDPDSAGYGDITLKRGYISSADLWDDEEQTTLVADEAQESPGTMTITGDYSLDQPPEADMDFEAET